MDCRDKNRSLDARGLGKGSFWPLSSSTREFLGVMRLFSILIVMVCGPQSHKTEYQKKTNICLNYIIQCLHGCSHLSRRIEHIKWVNLVVCKLYLNKVAFLIKVNLDYAVGPGGPQRGQFQKHLVSKPPGSPQDSAENMTNILNLCWDKKKVFVGTKGSDFPTWTCSRLTFITCSAFITILICTVGIVISCPLTSQVYSTQTCSKDLIDKFFKKDKALFKLEALFFRQKVSIIPALVDFTPRHCLRGWEEWVMSMSPACLDLLLLAIAKCRAVPSSHLIHICSVSFLWGLTLCQALGDMLCGTCW